MPIYEYRCEDCGHTNEVLMPRGAAAPPCPDCGSQRVRKALSLVAMFSRRSGDEAKCEGFSEGCAAECPSAGRCAMLN
jgi:putative FmdB family regulatory protein